MIYLITDRVTRMEKCIIMLNVYHVCSVSLSDLGLLTAFYELNDLGGAAHLWESSSIVHGIAC